MKMIRKAIRKINESKTFYLNETTNYYDPRIKQYVNELQNTGWQFYVANHTHGYCNATTKQIVIPAWCLFIHGKGYATWYIAHEMAHAYDMCKSHHGAPFMKQLMRICPKEYQIHEYGYKPELAMAAGLHIDKALLM